MTRGVPAGTRIGHVSDTRWVTVYEVGDLCGRLGLHAGENVGVLLEREGGRLVAEVLGNDLGRDPSLQGDGGVRMAEVMKANRP